MASQLTDESLEESPAAYLSGLYVGAQFGRCMIRDRGYCTWGVFGNYQARALKTLFVGAQIGYNSNADRLCRDVEVLMSLTYLFMKRVTFSVKPGFVSETYCGRSEYHPAFTAAIGLGVCQRFHPFVAYRGVYAYRCNRFHVPSFHSVVGGLEARF